MKNRRAESGQVLVLIVLLTVGLLGFAALAIDGGILLTERRRAQNAADAGVMAAALDKIHGANLFLSALQRIESNGYSTNLIPCEPAGYDCQLGVGESWTVQVNNPPRWGDYAGNDRYIQITITSEVDTAFAHLVFSGPLKTTVEAVSRIWWEEELASGVALYANSPHDCKGIWFTGTGDTLIDGGYIYSNSDANAKNCKSGVQGGAGTVTVDPTTPGIKVVGGFSTGGSGSVNADIFQGVTPESLRRLFAPSCSGLSDWGAIKIKANQTKVLKPGNYTSITIGSPNSEVILEHGLYCIHGDKGFTGTGGTVRVEGERDDQDPGVTIYLEHGPFDLGGETFVDLWAETTPEYLMDNNGFDWKGMLVYVNPANAALVKITGTSDSHYSGMIFAPQSECVIIGTGDSLALDSQVICYTVKIAGTADIDIINTGDFAFIVPPAIDLVQ